MPVTVVPGGPVPVTVMEFPLKTTGGVGLMVRGIFSDELIRSSSSPILRLMDFSFPLESFILKSTLSDF